jgi:hypothetical protein
LIQGEQLKEAFPKLFIVQKKTGGAEMNKELLSQMKSLNRDERVDYFKMNKSSILDSALSAVNGGKSDGERKNPNSEIIPFEGNWFSSDGYVCNGEVIC